MAYPLVQSVQTFVNDTETSSHDVTLPSGISSGDLLLTFLRVGHTGVTVSSTPTGWTELENTPSGDRESWYLFGRVADETEGATVTYGLTGNKRLSAITYRVSGWEGTLGNGVASVDALGSSSPELATGWTADDIVWFAAISQTVSDSEYSVTNPTNYGDQVSVSTASSTASDRTSIYTARRALNAATETPGSWSFSGTNSRVVTMTVAVRPSQNNWGFTITDIKEPNESDTLVTGISNARVLVWLDGDDTVQADEEITNQSITDGDMTVELTVGSDSNTPKVYVDWDAGGGETKFFPATPTIIDLDA